VCESGSGTFCSLWLDTLSSVNSHVFWHARLRVPVMLFRVCLSSRACACSICPSRFMRVAPVLAAIHLCTRVRVHVLLFVRVLRVLPPHLCSRSYRPFAKWSSIHTSTHRSGQGSVVVRSRRSVFSSMARPAQARPPWPRPSLGYVYRD
jgi:hypothetical protein